MQRKDVSLPKELPEKFKKIFVFSLKTLVITLPFILAIYFTYYYFIIYLSPEKVLTRTYKNLVKVESVSYSSRTDLTLKFGSNGEVEVSNSGSSGYLNLKSEFPGKYEIVAQGSLVKKETGLEADSEVKIVSDGSNILTGNVISADRNLYFKVSNFLYRDLIQKDLLNNWVKVSGNYFESKLGISSPPESPNNKNGEKGGELIDLLIANPPIKIVDVFPSDKIGRFSAFHYRYQIDKESLIKILETRIPQRFNLPDENSKNWLNFVRSIDFSEGDIWISKQANGYLRITGKLSLANAGSEGNTISIDFDVSLDNFDQASLSPVPNDFKDIDNLVR